MEVAISHDLTALDAQRIRLQLGRPARGVRYVKARCDNGWPTVVETAPRLDDGTPFPTFYYLTCRRLSSAISTLESSGLMREYQELLNGDPGFAARYREAHSHYVAARNAVQDVTEISQVSAGGMPDRVKCLHALVGHSLATGPGVNPVGDLAVGVLMTAGSFPHEGDCVHNSEVS